MVRLLLVAAISSNLGVRSQDVGLLNLLNSAGSMANSLASANSLAKSIVNTVDGVNNIVNSTSSSNPSSNLESLFGNLRSQNITLPLASNSTSSSNSSSTNVSSGVPSLDDLLKQSQEQLQKIMAATYNTSALTAPLIDPLKTFNISSLTPKLPSTSSLLTDPLGLLSDSNKATSNPLLNLASNPFSALNLSSLASPLPSLNLSSLTDPLGLLSGGKTPGISALNPTGLMNSLESLTAANPLSALNLSSLATPQLPSVNLSSLTDPLGILSQSNKLMQSLSGLTGVSPLSFTSQEDEPSSSDSATIDGIAGSFLSNGYLNPAGQSALQLSGLAAQAYNYPDLASALTGLTPMVDSAGNLTQAVQSGLKQMGVNVQSPSDLISTALSMGFSRRLVAESPDANQEDVRPVHERQLSNWLEDTLGAIMDAGKSLNISKNATDEIKNALNSTDWRAEVQSAAEKLATQLDNLSQKLRDGELPDKLDNWWKQIGTNSSSSASETNRNSRSLNSELPFPGNLVGTLTNTMGSLTQPFMGGMSILTAPFQNGLSILGDPLGLNRMSNNLRGSYLPSPDYLRHGGLQPDYAEEGSGAPNGGSPSSLLSVDYSPDRHSANINAPPTSMTFQQDHGRYDHSSILQNPSMLGKSLISGPSNFQSPRITEELAVRQSDVDSRNPYYRDTPERYNGGDRGYGSYLNPIPGAFPGRESRVNEPMLGNPSPHGGVRRAYGDQASWNDESLYEMPPGHVGSRSYRVNRQNRDSSGQADVNIHGVSENIDFRKRFDPEEYDSYEVNRPAFDTPRNIARSAWMGARSLSEANPELSSVQNILESLQSQLAKESAASLAKSAEENLTFNGLTDINEYVVRYLKQLNLPSTTIDAISSALPALPVFDLGNLTGNSSPVYSAVPVGNYTPALSPLLGNSTYSLPPPFGSGALRSSETGKAKYSPSPLIGNGALSLPVLGNSTYSLPPLLGNGASSLPVLGNSTYSLPPLLGNGALSLPMLGNSTYSLPPPFGNGTSIVPAALSSGSTLGNVASNLPSSLLNISNLTKGNYIASDGAENGVEPEHSADTSSSSDLLLGNDTLSLPPSSQILGNDSLSLPPSNHILGNDSMSLPPANQILGNDSMSLPPANHILGNNSMSLPPTAHTLAPTGEASAGDEKSDSSKDNESVKDPQKGSSGLESFSIDQIQNMLDPSQLSQSISRLSDELSNGGLDSLLEHLGVSKSSGLQSLGSPTELQSALKLAGLDVQNLPGLRAYTSESAKARRLDPLSDALNKYVAGFQNHLAGTSNLSNGLNSLNTGLLSGLGRLNGGIVNGSVSTSGNILNLDSGIQNLLGNIDGNLGSLLGNVGGGMGNLGTNLDGLGANIDKSVRGTIGAVGTTIGKTGATEANSSSLANLGNGLSNIKIPSLASLDSNVDAGQLKTQSTANLQDAAEKAVATVQENMNKLLQSLNLPTLPPPANLSQLGVVSGDSLPSVSALVSTPSLLSPSGLGSASANDTLSSTSSQLNEYFKNLAEQQKKLLNPSGAVSLLSAESRPSEIMPISSGSSASQTSELDTDGMDSKTRDALTRLFNSIISQTITSQRRSLGSALLGQSELSLPPTAAPASTATSPNSASEVSPSLYSTVAGKGSSNPPNVRPAGLLSDLSGSSLSSNHSDISSPNSIPNLVASPSSILSSAKNGSKGLQSEGITNALGSTPQDILEQVMKQYHETLSKSQLSLSNPTNPLSPYLDNQNPLFGGSSAQQSIQNLIQQQSSALQNLMNSYQNGATFLAPLLLNPTSASSSLTGQSNSNTLESLAAQAQKTAQDALARYTSQINSLGSALQYDPLGSNNVVDLPSQLLRSQTSAMNALKGLGASDSYTDALARAQKTAQDAISNLALVNPLRATTQSDNLNQLIESYQRNIQKALGLNTRRLDASVPSAQISASALMAGASQGSAVGAPSQAVPPLQAAVGAPSQAVPSLQAAVGAPSQAVPSLQAATPERSGSANPTLLGISSPSRASSPSSSLLSKALETQRNAINTLNSQMDSLLGTNTGNPNSNRTTTINKTMDLDALVAKLEGDNVSVNQIVKDISDADMDLNSLVHSSVNGKFSLDELINAVAGSKLDLDKWLREIKDRNISMNQVLHDVSATDFSIDGTLQRLSNGGVDLNKMFRDIESAQLDLDTLLKQLPAAGVDLDVIANSPMLPALINAGVLTNGNLPNLISGFGNTSHRRSLRGADASQLDDGEDRSDIHLLDTETNFTCISNSTFFKSVIVPQFTWDPRNTRMLAPLLICWDFPSQSPGIPQFLVDQAQVNFFLKDDPKLTRASIDLLRPDVENVFHYYSPHWNDTRYTLRRQNNLCTHVPLCTIYEALNKIHTDYKLYGLTAPVGISVDFTSSVSAEGFVPPAGRVLVRGVGFAPIWTQGEQPEAHEAEFSPIASILQNITQSPVFGLELPRPESRWLSNGNGYAVVAGAKSKGIIFEFTDTDWAWIPSKFRPGFSRLLEQVQEVGEELEEGQAAEPPAPYDREEEYEAMNFNPKRDLPVRVQSFSFMPRLILEVNNLYPSDGSTFTLQRCLPSSQTMSAGESGEVLPNSIVAKAMEMFYASANATASVVRVKSFIEAVAVEALLSGQEATDTINLNGSLIDTYTESLWNLNVQLTAVPLSDDF